MDKEIKVEVYFGSGNLDNIITELIKTKLTLWSIQFQEESEKTGCTTIDHLRGVVAD